MRVFQVFAPDDLTLLDAFLTRWRSSEAGRRPLSSAFRWGKKKLLRELWKDRPFMTVYRTGTAW